MSGEDVEQVETIPSESCSSSASFPESPVKWMDSMNPDKIIGNLERFVLSSSTDKSYNTAVSEGISSSKKTLDSLLARNGGHQNKVQNCEGNININNKNYTLDANGRVCLVKNTDKKNNHRAQEVLQLERDIKNLRMLQKNTMNALEITMNDHRKMMLEYLKETKRKPRKVPKETLEFVMNFSKAKMMNDFVNVAKMVDQSIAEEEIETIKKNKIISYLNLETFLIGIILEMDDIRDLTVEKLVNKWRSTQIKSKLEKEDQKLEVAIKPSGDHI